VLVLVVVLVLVLVPVPVLVLVPVSQPEGSNATELRENGAEAHNIEEALSKTLVRAFDDDGNNALDPQEFEQLASLLGKPLVGGVDSEIIPNEQITCSSFYDESVPPNRSRLDRLIPCRGCRGCRECRGFSSST
jgi:hypothetical protein